MRCYDLIHGALDCILKGPGLNLVRLMCFVLEQKHFILTVPLSSREY